MITALHRFNDIFESRALNVIKSVNDTQSKCLWGKCQAGVDKVNVRHVLRRSMWSMFLCGKWEACVKEVNVEHVCIR